MVPLKDVQPLTGYIRGGVTALAAKKEFPVYLDETAILFDVISVSAGVRGTQILLNPADYITAVNATDGRNRKAEVSSRVYFLPEHAFQLPEQARHVATQRSSNPSPLRAPRK